MSSENSIVEKTNLLDLEEINKEAEKYEIDLILIGGNSSEPTRNLEVGDSQKIWILLLLARN